jgi:hypothetical protein
MADVGGSGALNLSQIINWDTAHLETAATDWSEAAAQWEKHFTAIPKGTLSPGGTAWEGVAADSAQDRTFTDLVKGRGLADSLYSASSIARNGANDLAWAKNRVLEATTEAEEARFTVGEDLSVHDSTLLGSLRSGLARQHAEMIATRAGELSGLDKDIAAKITAALAPLSEVNFNEPPEVDLAGSFQALAGFRPDLPERVNVICIEHAKGMPWEFECLVHYPDGTTDIYNTDEDESGIFP